MKCVTKKAVIFAHLILWANLTITSSDILGDETHDQLFSELLENISENEIPSTQFEFKVQIELQDINMVNDIDQSFSVDFTLTYMW